MSFILLLIAAHVLAADPIRAYVGEDHRIRLWMKGAPSIVASHQAGWSISPPGKEKNETWLQRLKNVSTNSDSPWSGLLDQIEQGTPPSGVTLLLPKAVLKLNSKPDGSVSVNVEGTSGADKFVVFSLTASGYRSDKAPEINLTLSRVLEVAPESIVSALNRSSGESASDFSTAFDAFLRSRIQQQKTGLPDAFAPIVVESSKGPMIVAVSLDITAKPISPIEMPATQPGVDVSVQKKIVDLSSSMNFLGGFIGLLVGFGLGWIVHRPTPRASVPQPKAAAETDTYDIRARLAQRDAELVRAKSALEQARRSAEDYRDQHSSWQSEKEQTLRALEEAKIAHLKAQTLADSSSSALRVALEESQRSRSELTKQLEVSIDGLQKAKAELDSTKIRAKTYSDLVEEVAEAFNFVQSEIGRPEVAASVGYLLNFSCAELLESLANPNRNRERAMLSNIERIAGQFASTPHARKLAATAQKLGAAFGDGTIPESTVAHAHARHFDEVLRFLRNQRGMELSPFYFGIDSTGAVHAVYV